MDAIIKKETIEEENNDRLQHIKLSRPVTYNGDELTELDFDFDSLTGADAMNIEAELQAMGIGVFVESASGPYMIRMAAKACTVPIGADFFDLLPMKDYSKIRRMARNFLLAAE